MNLFGLGSSPLIEIKVDGLDTRKHTTFRDKNSQSFKLPVYTGEDDISGTVELKMNKCKKWEHQGIRIELVGHIEMMYDKNQSTDFMSMARELEPSGLLVEDKSFKFSFNKFEKQYETYFGLSVKLRATIIKKYPSKILKEFDFAVLLPNVESEPSVPVPLKMEVGIEDCLHIEFEYNKGKYFLKDCVIGKVSFVLVKIKLKFMELDIIRRETIGTENETIAKYEVMDGCPKKGELIPIRLFLSGYDLSPTYKSVNGKFSVKYFLNLVLVDEEDRRYFKQQEIQLYRKK